MLILPLFWYAVWRTLMFQPSGFLCRSVRLSKQRKLECSVDIVSPLCIPVQALYYSPKPQVAGAHPRFATLLETNLMVYLSLGRNLFREAKCLQGKPPASPHTVAKNSLIKRVERPRAHVYSVLCYLYIIACMKNKPI